MRLETLASGSSGNAYLLESEEGSLLIEAGLPFRKLQAEFFKRGKSMSALSGCLISHAHGDHAKGAKQVNQAGIPVIMSKSCADQLCQPGEWPFLHVCSPLKRLPFGPFHITPFAMKHDIEQGSYGFVIDILDPSSGVHSERLCYISDARFTEYKVPDVTIWAIEANYDINILRRNVANGLSPVAATVSIETHMEIETTIKTLKANDLSRCERVYLLHLSNSNSDAADFKARVEAATGIPCSICGGE